MNWISEFLALQEETLRKRRIAILINHRRQDHLAYTKEARRTDDYDLMMEIT